MQQAPKRMMDQAASRHGRPDGRAAVPAGRIPPHSPGAGLEVAAELPLRKDGRAAGSSASRSSPAGRPPMIRLPHHTAEDMRVRSPSPMHAAGDIPQVSLAAHRFGRSPHLAGPVQIREHRVLPGAAATVCGERQVHWAIGGTCQEHSAWTFSRRGVSPPSCSRAMAGATATALPRNAARPGRRHRRRRERHSACMRTRLVSAPLPRRRTLRRRHPPAGDMRAGTRPRHRSEATPGHQAVARIPPCPARDHDGRRRHLEFLRR